MAEDEVQDPVIPPVDPPADPNKDKDDINALKAQIAELQKLIKPPKSTTKSKATKYEIQYADKLKAELGDKYDVKYETMEVGHRIDTMEAVIKALKGNIPPIVKKGGEAGVGTPPPEKNTTVKTFSQRNKESGYRETLMSRGSTVDLVRSLMEKK